MRQKLLGLVTALLFLLCAGCSDQAALPGAVPSTKPTIALATLPPQLVPTTLPPQTSSVTLTPQAIATTVKDATTPTQAGRPTTIMPNQTPAATWWQPTPDQPIHWHWQLSDVFVFPRDVVPGVRVYDIDGELNSAETVARLHSLGPDIKVICYFDAGVFESYRSDASRFPKSVIGNADEGWNDSFWLDIRQLDIVLPIMKDRMQKWCKDKGFDAVEPDETEVWSNDPGFPITREQNIVFNKKIAEMAHSMGLSVGLKGNTSEAPDLWPYFDWSLNEQCWEFDECQLLKKSFIDHGKAVFNIEYNVDPNCKKANTWHMNSARRDLHLVSPTNPAYRYSPCVPDSKPDW